MAGKFGPQTLLVCTRSTAHCLRNSLLLIEKCLNIFRLPSPRKGYICPLFKKWAMEKKMKDLGNHDFTLQTSQYITNGQQTFKRQ